MKIFENGALAKIVQNSSVKMNVKAYFKLSNSKPVSHKIKKSTRNKH